MIIYIFGKSGSGKSYLAERLEEKLPNAVHLNMDEVNSEIMNLATIKDFAVEIFGKNVLVNNQLDKKYILNTIKDDEFTYLKWSIYMLMQCEEFVKSFIKNSSKDYYIIDHLNAGKLLLEGDKEVYVECIEDDETRLARLQSRDNITKDVFEYRDRKYIPHEYDIRYANNFEEVLEFINKNSTSKTCE